MVIPLPHKEEISLYFHIPFCKKKCGYCHFFVLKDEPSLHDILMKGFLEEIERAKEHLQGRLLTSIYFGGGTPSLMDPKNIDILLNKVEKTISFSHETEITMEFNPESSDEKMFSSFKEVGINRASIGIQSFDDSLLTLLTRNHSSERGKKAVLDAFHAGIDNISIDLMYEVPKQTKRSWQETLFYTLNLPITHLSLYNLTFEEGTSFFRKKEQFSSLLPKDEESLEMLLFAIDTLEKRGFFQYEISAFAKKGFHSRHNTGYWLGREFLGFGPSAFSYFQGKRFRNIENLKSYITLLSQKKSPVDFEETLSQEERIRELFTIQLRINSGILKEGFEKLHGSLPEELSQILSSLVKEELLLEKEGYIALTDRGRLFFNEVAARII